MGLLLPLLTLTVTVTVSACAVEILKEEGVIATVGVILGGTVTVTDAVPEALL